MDIDAATNEATKSNGIDSLSAAAADVDHSKESVIEAPSSTEGAAISSESVSIGDQPAIQSMVEGSEGSLVNENGLVIEESAASVPLTENSEIKVEKETEPSKEEDVAVAVAKTEDSTSSSTTTMVKEETVTLHDGLQTTILSVKEEQTAGDDDEVEDMNVGSDDFDTPSPPKQQIGEVKEQQDMPEASAPPHALPAAPTPTPTPATTTVSETAIANEDAASTFLQQTFDSFSKKNKPVQPFSNIVKNDVEEYRKSLQARIQRDRRDGDAWLALINDTVIRANLTDIRQVYEDFFVVFPNAARQWQDYASMELANSEFEKVESIFTRCLRSTPSTDLWRVYLLYTRRVNPIPLPSKGAGEDTEREKVRKLIEGAYDFALRFIGQSRDSGEVWRDYITLLKERDANNQWQAGQKMDDIRRAYQRAVSVPLANVELIWREYDAYENGLNRITAKKFLAERSPAYMTARTIFREMKTLTDSLYRPNIPKVPSWAAPPSLSPIISPITVARDRGQIDAWKKYLLWEETNPLQLEDLQSLQSRVLVAYRKATMHLRFFPEIWYMAYSYCNRAGRLDESATWLKNGMEACDGSFLLHFAYIELAEARSQVQDCGEVFQSLIDWVHSQIEAMQKELDEVLSRIDEEGKRIKEEASARRRDEGAADVVEGEEREELRKLEEEREKRREFEREKVRPKVEELQEQASLVWIKYMHFVRRQEGQRPSRAIFARARKSKHCTWQVYEANALMEYHCSKDVSVATKVFELALKTYGEDEAFVVRYLDFLLSINDDNNARALFERTIGTFPPERARPIWDRWSEYEYSFGDSSSIAKIDERLAQVYSDEMPVKRLVDRNSYMDLDVVGPRDLGLRTVIGGSSAAERAVAASREIAQEAAGSLMMANVPTGPSGRSYPGGGEDDQQQLPMKRARFGDSPIPSGPRTIPMSKATRRSASPPSRFVPPPRGEPPAGPVTTQPPLQPAPPQYIEIPDGVMYFLDCLPSVASFDGPRLPADDIIESLLRSNLPLYDFNKAASNGLTAGAAGFGQGGAQGRNGRRRSGRSRRH